MQSWINKNSKFLLMILVMVMIHTTKGSSDVNANKSTSLEGERQRKGKLFSVFQVITFSNSPCDDGTGGKNGTCYTAEECRQRGGNEGGPCAEGFGVCCTVTITCGQTSSENCTYFEPTSITAGACNAHICPCSSGICQMRLDFDTFVTAGPSTNTISTLLTTGGVLRREGSNFVTSASRCVTDTFVVRGPGGVGRPPTICGTNSGEHMYVEVGDSACTQLLFTFSAVGVHTSIPTRAISIKVTQYSCSFPNLAPKGCTQYFHSSTSGGFQSYNYNNGNGMHLDQQDQTICFRICYFAENPTDFQVSGTMATLGKNNDNVCGSYFTLVTTTTTSFPQEFGYDHLNIPGASTANNANLARSNVCGRNAGLVTVSQGASASICSTLAPFFVNFRTDAYEEQPEVTFQNTEFTLRYMLDAINCNLS